MKHILATLLLVSTTTLAQPPNIILILADDMGWTGTSSLMDEQIAESKSDFYQTPNIDQLAKAGMRFARAYSPAALCTPSRAAILTGKTPAELHMTTPGGGCAQAYQKLAPPSHIKNLPEIETTIAEVLKKQGYATAHLGKWHLGRGNPGTHGFDVHDGSTSNESGGTESNPKDIFGITERACEFMEKNAKTGTPFYLQLSHYAVHSPVEALDDSKERFSKLPKGERHSNTAYAAMTWDLDASIGTLLNQLDELNLVDNTYVVFMSDNGTASNLRHSQNLPLAGGKGSFYEGGIRVPLIIRGPGIQPNSFSLENVTGCDLFPTFSEWVGIPSAGKTEGVSLVPLLGGKPEPFHRTEKSFLFHHPHYGKGPNQKPQSALMVGSYKLIKDLETGTVKLFDLDNDISEKTDLSTAMPEQTEKLKALLNKRLKQVEAQMPNENPDYDPDAESSTRRRKKGR
jgi:arylsulfatase A-like enzyme